MCVCISFVWVGKMTEVTFNYRVLVSAREIRGYAVSAWCIQNDDSLFSSPFQRKIYLTIRLSCKAVFDFLLQNLFITLMHVCAHMHYWPSCVCLHDMLAHLLQSVLCIWPTAMPRSCAAALCKHQASQWDAKEEAWHCVQFFGINSSQSAREEESDLALITQ